jgi:drug/metabolite transporter (DMT)-like permease
MRRSDLFRLVALAAIWSASFVFIRVLVPAFGPLWVATLRVLIAGAALVAWFAFVRLDANVRGHWRGYLLVGLLSAALPFVLFAYAALELPASYLVILNAATPLFAALASAL